MKDFDKNVKEPKMGLSNSITKDLNEISENTNEISYSFEDLFDLSEIQEIQDKFSTATGVASIITRIDGTPITSPSNFSYFCNEIVRKTERGFMNCMYSDSIIGSPCLNGPRIQKCLSGGLMDGGVSIIVEGTHIANWLVGQVLDYEANIDDLLDYADEIGVDRNIYSEALQKVTRMSKEQFTDICDYLHVKAQQLSGLAHKNILLTVEINKRIQAEKQIKEWNATLEKKIIESNYLLEETNSVLEETNAQLEEEIEERIKKEEELRELNSNLDLLIVERTNQLHEINVKLEETNASLEEEIYEKEKVQEALKKSEELYRSVYDNSPLAFIIWDVNYKVIDWNKRAEEIFGWKKEEILGKRIIDFIVPKGIRTDVTNEVLNILESGIQRVNFNENITKDGKILYCEWHNTQLHDRSGNLIGAVSLGLDKTKSYIIEKEMKEAKEKIQAVNSELNKSNAKLKREIAERIEVEEALTKSKLEAEHANLAKSQFLANMSHEIRTPMNGIIGMTDLTLMSRLTKEQEEQLNLVKKSAKALLTIINDILDYTKIEEGGLTFEIKPFSLNQIINEVLAFFDISARQKDIKINFYMDNSIPELIYGDAVRLRQVLSNLLGNAVKFTHKGEINISINLKEYLKDKVTLLFSVSDTGIGISKDKQGLLFDRFSQLDSSYTKKYQGTGLGLAISKKLVEMMGGEIWVNSDEGQGAVFSFTSEFKIDEICYKINRNSKNSNIIDYFEPDSNKKILVVEDDEVSRLFIYTLLNKQHYHVLSAQDGEKAIEMYKNNKFDIILMDVQMPILDGLSATRVIRDLEYQSGEHVPIIAMTAYVLAGDKEKCLAAGMDDYISKPVDVTELLITLEKYK